MLGVNIPGINASSVAAFWSPWLVNILASNNKKDYDQRSQVAPLLTATLWETWTKGEVSGSRELSIRPLCLALNSWSHTKHRWAARKEQGESWRLNCHSAQRKKNPEIVKAKFQPGPPFLPQQNCSGNSRHDTFPLSFSRGNRDLGLLVITIFTSCTDCCCGIQPWLSG